MELITARLALRPASPEHVDLHVELDADPEVMRYISGGRASTRLEIEQIVRGVRGTRWTATLLDSGLFVGWFSLRSSGPGEFDLGYRLRRAMWGQGLATEGTRALVDHAFTARDAARVWAQTMMVNARSRAVMERCGLRYLRTFRYEWPDVIEGGDEGDVEYELAREDWLASRNG